MDALKDADVLSLRLKLKEISEEENEEGGRKRFLGNGRNWLWLAALLLILVSFGIVTALLVKDIQREKQLMADYMNDEMYSVSGLNKELMKYGMRSHGQVIQSPSDTCNMIMEGDILFSWTVDSTYNLLLDVINREGKVVFESYRPVQSPYLFENNYPEGIYVFRFRNDKETFSLTMVYLKD